MRLNKSHTDYKPLLSGLDQGLGLVELGNGGGQRSWIWRGRGELKGEDTTDRGPCP